MADTEIDFPPVPEIFDDDDDEYLRLVCTAFMVPSWLFSRYTSKEMYELAELKAWIKFKEET